MITPNQLKLILNALMSILQIIIELTQNVKEAN